LECDIHPALSLGRDRQKLPRHRMNIVHAAFRDSRVRNGGSKFRIPYHGSNAAGVITHSRF
jgi:hypothetical protein